MAKCALHLYITQAVLGAPPSQVQRSLMVQVAYCTTRQWSASCQTMMIGWSWRSIYDQMLKRNETHVLLDISHRKADEVRTGIHSGSGGQAGDMHAAS